MPRFATSFRDAVGGWAADASDEDEAGWHSSWAHVPLPTWNVGGASVTSSADAPGTAQEQTGAPAPAHVDGAASQSSAGGGAWAHGPDGADELVGGNWQQYTAADFGAGAEADSNWLEVQLQLQETAVWQHVCKVSGFVPEAVSPSLTQRWQGRVDARAGRRRRALRAACGKPLLCSNAQCLL